MDVLQLTKGRYTFVPERSVARVRARAPGHDFHCEGSGLTGFVELAEDRILGGRAVFPLERLAAKDALGNHELRKFLALDPKAPAEAREVRVELDTPIVLSPSGGEVFGAGQARFSLGRHEARAVVRVFGTPAAARATFELTFTGLGYQPPKLLFLRVKDTLEIEVSSFLVLEP